MSKPTQQRPSTAGEKDTLAPPRSGKAAEGAGNPLNQHPEAGKVPSDKPSFSSIKDEPLATAGIVGSDDPQGRVRPGGGEVPADSPENESDAESGYAPHPDRLPAKKRNSAV